MNNKTFQELDIDEILPNRFQPRIKFNETSLNELSTSIQEHGVIEPIVVRKLGDKYEIIAGERRYKATVLAGITKIPAIITDMNDRASSEVALIENVQREDLTPIEEAISYKKILDMNYLTQQELAVKLGKNQSTVANKLRLLELADEVQEALLDIEISERHARSLLKIKDKNKQIEVLEKIINERLTVRKTDDLIQQILKEEAKPTEQKTISFADFETVDLEEETKMDNDFIPEVVNINNDIKPTEIENVNIEEVSLEPVQPIVNPGFVNVENIENTAQNIYEEKPLADLSSLLNSTPVVTEEVVEIKPTVIEQPEEFAFKTGKFFNILGNEEETETTKEEDNIFEASIKMEEAITADVNNSIQMPNFDDLFAVKTETPVVQPTIEPVQIIEPTVVQPIEQVMPAMPNLEEIITPLEASPVEQFAQTETKVEKEIDYSKFYEPLEDIVETPIETKTEEIPYNNYALRDTEEIEIKPIQTQTVSKAVVDMKTVINTIRNCAETIEKYGFTIDVDEIDLENIYQVTFNINKK